MPLSKEIAALIQLIDDPDIEVFEAVATKILYLGKEILPNLEQLLEVSNNETVQSRVELLIWRVRYSDLEKDFLKWANEKNPDLLSGAILIARFQYPDLNIKNIIAQIEQIRRNVWLDHNNYLTPFEQVNVLNSIIYSYYKLQGHELTIREPNYFFINKVLENKQGNAYSISIILLCICEMLDIPIFAIDIPRQFLLAYIDTLHNFLPTRIKEVQQIQFYIDPVNGIVFTQKDVDMYLRKIHAEKQEYYSLPLSNKRIIYKMMEELAQCYRYCKQEHKANSITELMKLIIDEANS